MPPCAPKGHLPHSLPVRKQASAALATVEPGIRAVELIGGEPDAVEHANEEPNVTKRAEDETAVVELSIV